MDLFLGIVVGICLSAACGFRIFVPFLIMSIASLTGHLTLSPHFQWIGTYYALIIFATATVLEILAYYIPWVDNVLDTISAPVTVLAGIVAMASVAFDLSPPLQWSIAIIVGGGSAGIIHGGTASIRGLSSISTAGMGNFFISTGELIMAILTSLLGILLPLIAILLVGFLFILILWKFFKKGLQRKRAERSG
jgi:hypothetical protein